MFIVIQKLRHTTKPSDKSYIMLHACQPETPCDSWIDTLSETSKEYKFITIKTSDMISMKGGGPLPNWGTKRDQMPRLGMWLWRISAPNSYSSLATPPPNLHCNSQQQNVSNYQLCTLRLFSLYQWYLLLRLSGIHRGITAKFFEAASRIVRGPQDLWTPPLLAFVQLCSLYGHCLASQRDQRILERSEEQRSTIPH